MTREEWRLKWEQFGFVEDNGIASVMRGAKWLQFRRNVMLLKKTVPGSFPSVTH